MINEQEIRILTNAISNLAEKITFCNIKLFLEEIKNTRLWEKLKIEDILDIAINWLQQSIDICDMEIKK